MNTIGELYSGGLRLDTSAKAFGELRSSNDVRGDGPALRERVAEDGYLYLPGFLDRAEVQAVRHCLCQSLADDGAFMPGTPVDDAIAKPGLAMAFRPDLANASAPLKALLYGRRVMEFFDSFLGGPTRHYDFTWMRAIAPGKGSQPHCDIVFMGRGTPNVFTAWIPLGDIPLRTGGLIVLEGSHQDEELRRSYCSMDVDTACDNREGIRQVNAGGYPGFGALSEDAPGLRNAMGGRWLTAEYRMGDFVTFPMFTVHGSLDNQSREVRLSSDSRYQLASEPIDERWIGENPPGHGGDMVHNLIC
ncbi:MAG: phytanoyl-CoA dioxygenase family protein [Fimbriimonadaceae bacterium]